MRKTFTLGAAATAHIIMAVDDDYDLYINGELIGGNHDGVAGSDRYTNVPLRAGVNVLAVMAVDVAGGCQALSFDIFPPPEPPANDDVADAVVIPALDFTDARDTRGATTDPDDPSSCSEGGPNVWYTFTPREDMVVRLSTAGSSYDVFLDVFASTAEGLITCAWGELTFDASAGTTYYVMVSSPSSFGGDLVFAALDLGAPLQVTLSLNATGSFNPKTGDATIRGTVTCNQPAGVDMWGGVRQKLGRTIIQADFYLFVDCEGSTPWSATVRSNQGAFGGGPVEVSASASGCSPIDCGEDQVTATVKLSGKQ